MRSLNILSIISTGLIGLLFGVPITASAVSDRPNILFIFTDDQSHRTLSCYKDFGARPWVRTPNIDKLAAEGVLFSSAYGTSWCAPSRASVLTGLLPHGIQGVDFNRDQKSKRPWATYGDAFDPETVKMWPKNMRAAGYHTAMIGKWHVGQNAGHGQLWDHSVVWDQNDAQGDWYNDQLLMIDGGKPQVVPGYSTDVYTDFAEEYIDRKHEKPWFLWLCYNAPHLPNIVHPRHANDYADVEVPIPPDVFGPRPGKPDWMQDLTMFKQSEDGSPLYGRYSIPEMVIGYNQLVSTLDEGVGRLLSRLEDTGQLDNTLIIFTSDQGFAWGERGFAWKVGPYDACIQMPLIFRLPGKVAQGEVCYQPATIVDVIPTLLGFAQLPLPWEMHGHDLRPLLREPRSAQDYPIYMEHFLSNLGDATNPAITGDNTTRNVPWWLFLRKGRFKYIRSLVPNELEELYDLKADPDELENLALQENFFHVLQDFRKMLREEIERTQGEFAETLPAPAMLK